MPPFVLVDGSYFLFRAFHALPPLTTSTGLHTNAIRGAISAIQKLMRRTQPTHEYFTVDAKNGAFEDTADEKSFVSLLVTDGEGELTCGGETVVVKKGDSFFLPAGSGSYAVRGTCQTLVTRV